MVKGKGNRLGIFVTGVTAGPFVYFSLILINANSA